MGDTQEPDVLDEGGFGQETGEGDAAPEPLNDPAETGEVDEGEGEGEGEGSGKQDGAWSKDKAQITRLQQERAAAVADAEQAKKERLVAEARLELSKRQTPTSVPDSREPRTPEDRATASALNKIVRDELGMDLPELKAALKDIKGGIGNTALAAADATLKADPDSYPFYGQVRDQLLAYAREAGNVTPEMFEYAYSRLERPLATAERKATKAAKAKAKAGKRADISGAPLPGGGRSAGGGRELSLADIKNEDIVSDDDLKALIQEAEFPDS